MLLSNLGPPGRSAIRAGAVSRSGGRPFACPFAWPRSSRASTPTSGIAQRPQLVAAASSSVNMADTATTTTAVSIREELSDLFKAALVSAFPGVEEPPMIAACNNAKNGDYQCNNAMGLFGKLKGKEGAPKAPRDVATAILAALPPNDAVDGTSLAGPGFINLRLSPAYLAARVSRMLAQGINIWAPRLAGQRVVVDFSSPNVAKEMHVGHLRSTIIGDTLCRTLEFCGADVLRLNHIGDWGTQFGMLIQHMTERRPGGLAGAEGGGDGTQQATEDIADLQQLYRAAKARFDEEEDFKTRAREAVTRLQSGDAACLAAWRSICEASRKEFQAIYSRLGVELTERGESYYNSALKSVVQELIDGGVAVESDGAMCVFVDGSEVPLIVRKSDGGYGYASTDMAAIKQRLNDEKADWIIYVTDVGQAGHFDLVFAAARKAGWLADKPAPGRPRVSHVGFGLVMGEDGKKFKTRSGDVVRLVELLDEAVTRCRATIKARREEAGEPVDEAEVDASAAAMGYGAVKYADLKNSRLTNYKFSYDAMLDLKGNTAVYLQYAHARIAAIGRKSGRDLDALRADAGGKLVLGHAKEKELALALCRFPEAVAEVLDELMPNRLCEYLYGLSEAFNGFYTECKVIGSEAEDSRLLLCEATAIVMRQCFGLLGITPLYRI